MARKSVTDMSAWPSLGLEGNLVAPAMIASIDRRLAPEQTEADYRIRKGLTIREEISIAFRVGQSHFDAFAKLESPSVEATQRFIRGFLAETFGFDDLVPADGVVSFLAGDRVPIVVVPPSEEKLDRRSPTLSTDRARSPAFALQDYLNDSDGSLWGLVTNGALLRLMRDNASLTRPAYIEADLAQIFTNEDAASFAVLWSLIHRTRFGVAGAPATDCALERYRLSWLSDKTGMVPVNWRAMETEELGSVYESLLELQPQLGNDGKSLIFASEAAEQKGNQRKKTGSYYTPDSLVQLLLDTTLNPVLDEREARAANPAEELLKLTVIDPACGSGHFLLAAARRIATRVARHRAGGIPSAADFRRALREVACRCLYGVDRNPMAVELTKVALWIEALEPGRPLAFFDAQIRCGDSLIGVFDRAMLREGLPDEAYKPLAGDDKDLARRYARLNKEQRDRAKGHPELFKNWSPPEILTERDHKLKEMTQDNLASVEANPPLGWWAKKASGKKVHQTPLPEPKPGTSDRITIAGADLGREAAALATAREQARILASVGDDNEPPAPHPIVDRTLAKLSKEKPSDVGLVAVSGAGLIMCGVAPQSVDRLAVILPRIIRAALLQGFQLVAGEGAAHFKSETEAIGFSISELVKREQHVLTDAERAKEAAWERKRDMAARRNAWDSVFLDRPRFPEWDHQPTGQLSFEFERVYVFGGTAPRRSFRDARVQRLENMASEIGVGLAVLAAAKTEQRLKREAEQRRREEERRQRELVERKKHIADRRIAGLGAILAELDELDRLRRLIAMLTVKVPAEPAPRLSTFLSWAQEHLARREARLSPRAIEERFAADQLFGDTDDHAFVPSRWY